MWKKAIPNTLYTVAIVVCLIWGYEYGFEKGNYVLIVIFIILKIKILKEINNTLKKP
jgi:hypothetical protein